MAEILNIFIGIAIPVLLLFFVADRRMKLPIGFLLIGMAVCVAAGMLNTAVMDAYGYTPTELVRYVAPVVEEFLKVIPLIVFFLVKKPDLRTALIAAVALGVGFATIENISYFLATSAADIGFVLIRGLSAGIMHAVTLVIISLVLYRVPKLSAVRYLIILISILAFATTFHGLYNLAVNCTYPAVVWLGYIIPPAVAAVFLLIFKRAEISRFFRKILGR